MERRDTETFEQLLIEVIENIHLDQREIEDYIGPKKLEEALGRYKSASRGNVELSLVQCLNTSDLINIACKEQRIRDVLEYLTRTNAKNYLNPIVDLRNKIMHAGYLLVESEDDIKRRREQYVQVKKHISDFVHWLKKEREN